MALTQSEINDNFEIVRGVVRSSMRSHRLSLKALADMIDEQLPLIGVGQMMEYVELQEAYKRLEMATERRLRSLAGKPEIHYCIKCDDETPAEYVRRTQFSGTHYFCGEHAKKEEDFGESSSYAFWERLLKGGVETD